MIEKDFDVVIIGGGPGGYVAAIRAAQLGMKTCVVEKQHMGGICLNYGCIPTKALLRSAEIYHLIKNADEFGLKVNGISFNLKEIVQRSRSVAEKLASGVSSLMKKNKVEVITGFGKLNGKNKVRVEDNGKKIADLGAKHIILATGAKARTLPNLQPDGKKIVTYKEAMLLEELPKNLLVVGSGAIGIEFASFYNTLGSKVQVVEIMDRILPAEDEEISKLARKSFEKQGMTITTATTVDSLKNEEDGVTATLKKDGKTSDVKVDVVILALGIVANTENIGLEGTKIKLEKGHIKTDEWLQTGEKNVYAIGDVTTPPWLAHKASHEAVLCVEKIANIPHLHPIDKNNIPGCTYCYPQIASVGLTEKQAIEQGYKIKVGRFPFIGNGKAIALGDTEGLVKTIFAQDSGELLGAHMIGAEVTELINGFLVGKTMEATEEDFIHTIFPHPTLSEMMHESVLDAFDKVIHM